jgi:hypothetical protein
MDPNSHEALLRRREAAVLSWRGPTPKFGLRTLLYLRLRRLLPFAIAHALMDGATVLLPSMSGFASCTICNATNGATVVDVYQTAN